MPSRFPRLSRATRVLLALVAILAVAIALFDWNWFRHPLERYLARDSGREVRIGDLHVDLSLDPTVRVRDVYIENAPWASVKRPLIVASEASFTFSLASAWDRRLIISRLVLVDADVDLEREVDGRRNWRLTRPEYVGPGRVRVMRLEPHRSRIRFANRAAELDVVAEAAAAEQPDASHPMRIVFSGHFRGARFAGRVVTGGLLTLMDSGESFPLRGSASSRQTTLHADGTLADLLMLSAVDADLRMAGPSFAQLHPFVRAPLPASRPYELAAHVKHAERVSAFSRLRGKVGGSDVAGEFSIDRSGERAMLRASLRSESAELRDLGSFTGSPPVDARKDAAQRVFPDRPLEVGRLNNLDAQVILHAVKLKALDLRALESLRLTANLKDGVLALKPVDLGVAGGHASGAVTFDARQKTPSAHANLALAGVRLERLLDALPRGAPATGALKGRIDLRGAGDSVAKLLASARGNVELGLAKGSISARLDAKLALNVGTLVRLFFTGDRDIAINDAEAAFDFEKGVGRSRLIRFDTGQTHAEGSGTIDLRDETVDLLLTPRPKKRALLSLHRSIRVSGPLRKPAVSLSRR
jgi:uncharacterized protein involved in outer membrane biogenesis